MKQVTNKDKNKQDINKSNNNNSSEFQAIIMSNRFVYASSSTGALFYSNVTCIYSTGCGRPIRYRVKTPSNNVGLTECSNRFLHKKNLLGDLITSEILALSISLTPTCGISNQWSAVLESPFRVLNILDTNYIVDLVTRVDNVNIDQIKSSTLTMPWTQGDMVHG